jgi:putative exosortase-associated protein (TIGR04073 family)
LDVGIVRDPLRQLGRGVSNIFTGILEVPSNVNAVAKENGDVAGITWGLFRGIWRCGIRETVGVFEVLTFPFGWEPILEPEFPFEPGKSTEWRVNSPPFFE